MDWSGVDYCDVFISSHSDGTHPLTLLRHWCRDAFLQTWWRHKLILISDELMVNTFWSNSDFWVNIHYITGPRGALRYQRPLGYSITAGPSTPENLFFLKLPDNYLCQISIFFFLPVTMPVNIHNTVLRKMCLLPLHKVNTMLLQALYGGNMKRKCHQNFPGGYMSLQVWFKNHKSHNIFIIHQQ